MSDHTQARAMRSLLDFDGSVLEIFQAEGSKRFPASDLSFHRSEPERRKGRVTLTFSAFGGMGASLIVEPEELAGVDTFLAALESAGVARD
jgi:hypothetical protein